ncbi:MAG: hypothetical protein GF353_26900 [Candidatus Lokiarchaeota archaeon]|nr:hypothetical protein [Candidatus Lokiarchaeota archaeon]
MRKTPIYVLICLVITLVLFINFFIPLTLGAAEEFEPDYGNAPEIDGDIGTLDNGEKEWKNATKEEITLFSPGSTTDLGLLVDIWVMFNDSDLYISVQFELEATYRNSQEFIAILTSTSDAENNESFYDAKIVQFYDLGTINERTEFFDYYIVNGQFYRDIDEHGDGDADLDGDKSIYEFQIPINNSEEDDQDVFLDLGETYAFKVVYGINADYELGALKSNTILIDIEYPPIDKPEIWEVALLITVIIVFCGLGALYGFYVYRILIIRKKISRIRR